MHCAYLNRSALYICSDDAYEKALAYFGTAEVVDEACQGFLLGDGVKECSHLLRRPRD
ncbi:MAG: hypothetical protein AAB353_14755 [Candidatus Hydrogenedentota bacterium]